MRKLLWIMLVIVMSGASVPIIAQSSPAQGADSVPESLHTWQDLDSWRLKYAPKYDDGAASEGIADFVERMLADDWPSLKQLVSLSKTSPGLFEFAVHHLGEITTCKSAKAIVTSSIVECSSGLKTYCKKIQDALVPGTVPECLPVSLLEEHGIGY